MPTIAEIRQQSGDAYSDMSDQELGGAIYKKYYSDMPRAEFNKKVGLPEPEDVTAGMALSGIPVIGAYVPQAEAAIRAAAQPLTGVGAPGATWSERYAANLPQRQAEYAQAEQESPWTSEALKLGGGMAALAPIGATALGARALGAAGPMAARIPFGAASGAALSAADTAARGGSGEDIASAAKWGGGIGAVAPALTGAVSRAITPRPITDPTRAARVATLQQAGVQPTAGDITGSKAIQWAEQHLGGLAGALPAERTAERLSGAAIRSTGLEGATRATPEVVDKVFERLGNRFDELAAKHTLVPDQAFWPHITAPITEYERLVATPNQINAVAGYAKEIQQALVNNKNVIPGDVYQGLRSRIEADARGLARSDPQAANALRGIKNALDSGMERQLVRAGSADAGAWKEVRGQYRNALVLEKAATNPNTKLGLISPATLYSANKAVMGMRNVARGRSELAPLAQAASDIMRPLPSSGTAERTLMHQVPMALAGGVAGALYGQDPYSALGGAAMGVAPFAAGRALMSRPAQRYLANQLLTGPSRRALQGGMTGGLLNLIQP